MKKKVLGRGLEALIPEGTGTEPHQTEIDIDRVIPNPDQPRLKLDEKALEELAASIRANGVLQPILVRPLGPGYQLIAGERRLSAAQRAGLLKIPAVVRDVPDERVLELALVENIQREQLNPIEEAQAYHKLLETTEETQESLAARLGKERSTIANSLRLLKLPAPVKDLIIDGRLSPGHARALLASEAGPIEMAKIAAAMAEKGWSVRDAERWAKKRGKKSRAIPKREDPNIAAAADRLRLMLGTRVEIHVDDNAKGAGYIRISFYSAEDLSRIYAILTDKSL